MRPPTPHPPIPRHTHPPPPPCLAYNTQLQPKTPTSAAAQAHNNHRARAEQSLPPRPIPQQSDRHKAHRAPTHLRLRFDRPWPRTGPKRGAGIRPEKGVTNYVPRQLGDTVRDSKFGAPNGPLKKGLQQALRHAPTRPHGPKTNTPSPPFNTAKPNEVTIDAGCTCRRTSTTQRNRVKALV